VLVKYTYDYRDQLVERRAFYDDTRYLPGEVDRFVYDGDQVLARTDLTGNIKARYLWGPQVDMLLADEQYHDGTSDTYWALADHEQSVRDLVKFDAGQVSVVNHRVYDAFGKVTSEINPSSPSTEAVDEFFSFTGRFYDEASQLQNNLHRWYDPLLHQWLSEDPEGFDAGDANTRRYVGNDPVNNVDPDGREPISLTILGIGALIGGFYARHRLNESVKSHEEVWRLQAQSTAETAAEYAPLVKAAQEKAEAQFNEGMVWNNRSYEIATLPLLPLPKFKSALSTAFAQANSVVAWDHLCTGRMDQYVECPFDAAAEHATATGIGVLFVWGQYGLMQGPSSPAQKLLWAKGGLPFSRPVVSPVGLLVGHSEPLNPAEPFNLQNGPLTLRHPWDAGIYEAQAAPAQLSLIAENGIVKVSINGTAIADFDAPASTFVQVSQVPASPTNAYNISTAGMSAAERAAILEYAQRTNAWLAQNGPVTVQGTAGVLRSQANAAARAERLRAARAGLPYQGQAGHVPDTALSRQPNPPAGWLDMPGTSNQSAGGGLGPRIGQTVDVITVDGQTPPPLP
jgi:RHS repeat-associated protein